MKCYGIRKKKPMIDFVGRSESTQSLINMMSERIREYVIPEDNSKPIKTISILGLYNIIDNERQIKERNIERYQRNPNIDVVDIIRYRSTWIKRLDYLEEHIEIGVKAMNILINNYIVKHKLWEIDYPDDVCDLTDLSYNNYLTSERWQIIRSAALKRDGEKCVLCGSTSHLQGHHRSYKYKGKGDYSYELNDVYTLCERCHKLFHDNVDIKKLHE